MKTRLFKDTTTNEIHTPAEIKSQEEPLFTCYETEQTMSKKDWFLFYLTSDEIDKTEYKDFTEWWTDMRRSGVLEEA